MFTNIEGEWDEVMAVVKQAVDVVAEVVAAGRAGAQGRHPAGVRRPAHGQGRAGRARARTAADGASFPGPALRPARHRSRPPPPLPPPPPPRTRVALVIGVLGAALVVILAVSIPLVMGVWSERTGGSSSSADLADVHRFGGLSADHTERGRRLRARAPAGGPHDPAWLDCGVIRRHRSATRTPCTPSSTDGVDHLHRRRVREDDGRLLAERAARRGHPVAVPGPGGAGHRHRVGPPARAGRRRRPAAGAVHRASTATGTRRPSRWPRASAGSRETASGGVDV